MVPTCVSPKVSPCASWTTASTATGGSCAVISQRATAPSAPITTSIAGGSVNRGDSANTTISASTPSAQSAGDGQPAEAGGLPGDGSEAVIGGVAALDQRRRQDDGEKAGVAQQRAAPGDAGRGGLCRPSSGEARGSRAAPSPAIAGNDPDQMPGCDEVDQQPACQRADDEGRRAPQPQRSVIEAVPRHAAQRIGIGQRHHRRPHAGGDGKGEEHRQRLMLGAETESRARSANAVAIIAPRNEWCRSARPVTTGRS